ncbi:MAG: hypothetical protein U5R06_14365 [candidate division KSB1 bacterium]|nr:hypothetical protein [candidate division KSB1 bacterium]
MIRKNMSRPFVVLLLLFSFVVAGSQPRRLGKVQIDDYWHYHDAGNLGLTITNYGVIGEGYNNPDQPSCMYKLYTDNIREQIEHLSFGGLWVGGRGSSDGGVHVSTAIVDGVFESGEEGFEFTNTASEGDTIKVRSSLVTSRYYDPSAISHQDYICEFTDVNTSVPGTDFEIPNHEPLGLEVHLESYAWNYPYTEAFVILNYTIKNVSRFPIEDVYAGLWVDASIGNMNYTSIYEPGGGWSWYDNLNGFDIDYDMAYQYDVDGDEGFSESYLGIRYLGTSNFDADITVTYDQWRWLGDANTRFPDYVMPTNDEQRYQVMQGRHIGKYFNTVSAGGVPTDPGDADSWMLVINAGPLDDLAPGDSVTVVYAIVCGLWENNDQSDTPERRMKLRLNSDWAQLAYNGEDVDGDGKLDPNEDQNNNGVLDEGEDDYRADLDTNGNGQWDPGEEVFGDEDGHLDVEEDVFRNPLRGIEANNQAIDRYILPSPPPSPILYAAPGDGEVNLFWDTTSEEYEDPITRQKDFEGYRIYSAPKTESAENATLLAQFDKVDDQGYDTGFEKIKVDTVIDGQHYDYKFTNRNLRTGWPGEYWYAVTAYDKGNPKTGLPGLESSILENRVYVIPGTPANTPEKDLPVSVFPNPYRAQAAWDGTGDRERMLWFINLPARSAIRIYTLAGDLVDEIQHNGETYHGDDVRLMSERIGSNETILAGGMHAWDLISKYDQAVATGLYFFSVKDLDTGEIKTGKFAIIK